MAVFTSGELAMERAICAAAASFARAADSIVISFGRALAIARDLLASDSITAGDCLFDRIGHLLGIRTATPDAPLASSTSVSLVDVSPSTESRL